jgi:hypothetical protein
MEPKWAAGMRAKGIGARELVGNGLVAIAENQITKQNHTMNVKLLFARTVSTGDQSEDKILEPNVQSTSGSKKGYDFYNCVRSNCDGCRFPWLRVSVRMHNKFNHWLCKSVNTDTDKREEIFKGHVVQAYPLLGAHVQLIASPLLEAHYNERNKRENQIEKTSTCWYNKIGIDNALGQRFGEFKQHDKYKDTGDDARRPQRALPEWPKI